MSPYPISKSEGAVEAPITEEDIDSATGRPKPKPQWMRMLFHVVAMSVAAYLCFTVSDPHWRGGLTIGALVLGVLYELLRKTSYFRARFNSLVRRREVRTRAASTDFLMAMAICAFAFDARIAATAFLVAGFADPMARLFGIYFGTVRWRRSKKTIEGSIGFFMIAFAVLMTHRPTPPLVLVLVTAAAATWAEKREQTVIMTRLGPLITPADNALIPLVVCFMMTLLGKMS